MNGINSYWEEKKKGIQAVINLDGDYDFELDNGDQLTIFSGDKWKIKGTYGILGIYNPGASIWTWGWDIGFVDRRLTRNTKGLIKWAKELEDTEKYDETLDELFYIAKHGNFWASEENLEKVLKIGLFVVKGLWVFPVKIDENNMEYVILEKITQVHT